MDNGHTDFLRYCLDERLPLPESSKSIDWKGMMAWAEQQAVVGIIYGGIQRAGKSLGIPFDVLMEWIGYGQTIELQNKLTTEVCRMLRTEFEKDGFRTCILKGQANHAYYPERMRNLRTCGDVDIWVVPRNREEKHPVKSVLAYLEEKRVVDSLCYLHAEVRPVRNVPVEVHFRPSFMNEPRHNRRFLKLFGDMDECVCEKEIDGVMLPVLKWEYDVIFQLCHVYRHLIDEGVGLRQIIDYYYLLKRATDYTDDTDFRPMAEIEGVLRRLGLYRFAGAMMWVQKELLGLPEEYMICKPVEKDGRFLLDEILMAGNFGQSDPRMTALQYEKGRTSFQVRRAWRRIKRNSRFLRSYPSEVIWEPIARYSHFCWRKFKLYGRNS